MADETREERDKRLSEEVREVYENEGNDITSAAVDAREDEPGEEGLQTWEQYREHAANVPGIFGDTDTSGTAPEVDSVVTKNEELGGVSVARVDEEQVVAEGDDEQEEVEGVTGPEAKRQLDVAGPQPSAQEVEAGADDDDDNDDDDDDDDSDTDDDKKKIVVDRDEFNRLRRKTAEADKRERNRTRQKQKDEGRWNEIIADTERERDAAFAERDSATSELETFKVQVLVERLASGMHFHDPEAAFQMLDEDDRIEDEAHVSRALKALGQKKKWMVDKGRKRAASIDNGGKRTGGKQRTPEQGLRDAIRTVAVGPSSSDDDED